MLTLEIEFLTGVCFAAKAQSSPSEEPDWPPQPDRMFSALVAAWGARGEQTQEKAALEWLEQQPAPAIHASEASPRRVGTVFVPPGDGKGNISVLPEHRRRQARFFPAAIPERPLIRFQWTVAPEDDALGALQALAKDVAYVGHSASVVRCQFVLDPMAEPELKVQAPERSVYPGRMVELQETYRRGDRPQRGQTVSGWSDDQEMKTPASVFSDQWILLDDQGGDCPDLRGIAVVARRLRDALMSHYEHSPIPEVLSGHHADGSPLTSPHIAIVPLADVGAQYSSGRLMGVALVLPREVDVQRLNAERAWLAGFEDPDGGIERWRTFDGAVAAIQDLKLGAAGVWPIRRVLETSKKSLEPARYNRPAARWTTVTPIALDRYPKGKTPEEREEEMCATVAASCVNIGLPEPREVRLYKHASVRGAPSAYPSGKAPAWTRWALPDSLANRMLTHAVIEFREPVRGPVILGAGRFAGLGLCMGDRS